MPQSCSGHFEEDKKYFPLLGIQGQFFDHATYNQVTVLTGITATFFVTLCLNNVSDLMLFSSTKKCNQLTQCCTVFTAVLLITRQKILSVAFLSHKY